MNRPTLNYTLDWLAFLLFAALTATGLLLKFGLPHGGGGSAVLSLTRHEWGDIHFWVSLSFLAVVAVHLVLHSTWIKAMTVGKSEGLRRNLRAGAAVLAGAAAVAVSVFALLPRASESEGEGRGQGDGQSQHEGRGGSGRHRGWGGE